MALQNIVNVSISLDTAPITQAGFGTPIFIGKHRWFPQRHRVYTSATAAAAELGADSDELKAVNAIFSQTPAPTSVMVGRRNGDALLTPTTPTDGMVFSVTVEDQDGNTLVASYTAESGDTAEDVVDAIKAAIDGDAEIGAATTTTKTGTGASTTLTIADADTSHQFGVGSLTNIAVSVASTETASAVIAAVEEETTDFYYVTAHDHTETFVLAMAAAIEARSKVYAVSIGTVGSIAALADPATDILGKLAAGEYFRTIGMFHQNADTSFPECAYVGVGAPRQPGKITWSHKRLAGVSVSAHPTTGKKLSASEKNALADRNANFVEDVGGVAITREGKVVAGEWIDVITSRDLLVARITEAYQSKFINTPKVPYTDSGINSLRGVLTTTLNRYISNESTPNILDEANPYTTNFPKAADVPFNDKANRVLNASFKCYLAGAIHVAFLDGSLTYQANG
jgi:hypothetical protein